MLKRDLKLITELYLKIAENKSTRPEPEGVVFENNDLVVLDGKDMYTNIHIGEYFEDLTGVRYTYGITSRSPVSNMFNVYRNQRNGRSVSFYWFYFKNIPITDKMHLGLLLARENGTYAFCPANNIEHDCTWDQFLEKYKERGIDIDYKLKSICRYKGSLESEL